LQLLTDGNRLGATKCAGTDTAQQRGSYKGSIKNATHTEQNSSVARLTSGVTGTK
jgi:hypothetical protein